MLKLGKTSRLILITGVLGILCASLGVVYSQQGQEQRRLNQELSLAQQWLTQYSSALLSSQQKDLERQLAEAESRLQTARDSLSRSVESIEASDTLLRIAEGCDVEIIGIGSSAWMTQKLAGLSCSVLPLTVQVEGDVPGLIEFVYNWTKECSTGVVQSVEITASGTSDNETEENGGKAVANVSMLIYSYRGD